MKKLVIGAFAMVSLSVFACTPAEQQTAVNTALDVTTIACIIANAETTDQAVLTACNIAPTLLSDVQKVLASARVESRKYAATKLGSCVDGGK